MIFLQIITFVFFLMCLHELGHIIAARYLGLHIKKIGFQTKPYPHFFVAASWPRTNRDKNIYLFSGMFVTMCLFIFSIFNNFFLSQSLFFAFVIQIAFETNPFYSDITIAIVSSNKRIKYGRTYGIDYKEQFSNYQYSNYWYLHFILWTILIIILIKLNPLL